MRRRRWALSIVAREASYSPVLELTAPLPHSAASLSLAPHHDRTRYAGPRHPAIHAQGPAPPPCPTCRSHARPPPPSFCPLQQQGGPPSAQVVAPEGVPAQQVKPYEGGERWREGRGGGKVDRASGSEVKEGHRGTGHECHPSHLHHTAALPSPHNLSTSHSPSLTHSWRLLIPLAISLTLFITSHSPAMTVIPLP